jgi:hypothetical protein
MSSLVIAGAVSAGLCFSVRGDSMVEWAAVEVLPRTVLSGGRFEMVGIGVFPPMVMAGDRFAVFGGLLGASAVAATPDPVRTPSISMEHDGSVRLVWEVDGRPVRLQARGMARDGAWVDFPAMQTGWGGQSEVELGRGEAVRFFRLVAP